MTVLVSRAKMEEIAQTLQMIMLATVLLVIVERIAAKVRMKFNFIIILYY